MVARHRGEIVLAEAVGVANAPGAAAVAVTVQTPFQVMSVSKAVVAFAIAALEDRGVLDVRWPVARVWPEFAANGKGGITILDVLTHRSGLVIEALYGDYTRWRDWNWIVDTIAAAPPDYRRGTLAYEAYTFGWVLGEVVRRTCGRGIDELVDDLLAPDITGLHLRAPAAQAPSVAYNQWLGSPNFRLGRVRLADDFQAANNGFVCFEALAPGAGMIADALSLTAFYDMLLRGGRFPSGRQVVRDETLAPYLRLATSGRDRITGAWVRLGRGFGLGWPLPHPYGWWGSSRCFGHPGGFGMLEFADPEAELAVAIFTTANRGLPDLVRRFAPLSGALRRGARSRVVTP